MPKLKTPEQMERHLKGISNHYRIEILLYLDGHQGATLENIAAWIEADVRTIGEHTRRLRLAGLIDKKYHGRTVQHTLSPYGKIVTNFLKLFQKI